MLYKCMYLPYMINSFCKTGNNFILTWQVTPLEHDHWDLEWDGF